MTNPAKSANSCAQSVFAAFVITNENRFAEVILPETYGHRCAVCDPGFRVTPAVYMRWVASMWLHLPELLCISICYTYSVHLALYTHTVCDVETETDPVAL
jgi:hypothetical protein